MSKVFLYIGGGIFIIFALVFVADYFLNIPLLRSIPGIGQIACQLPITVSGSSMNPAIKAGSRVTFNKCHKNKEDLPLGIIILYSGKGNNSIARIKERVPQQEGFIYKASKDSGPKDVFDVRPDQIIGILEQ